VFLQVSSVGLWVPSTADGCLMSDINLKQAKSSRLQRVAGLRLINVTTVWSLMFFRDFVKTQMDKCLFYLLFIETLKKHKTPEV
jgi:hypothetical protein